MRGRLLALIGLMVSLSSCSSSPLSMLDAGDIRNHFSIPSSTKIESYWCKPPRSSMFGRPNLTIRAHFKFTDEEFANYMKSVEVESKWAKMPLNNRYFITMSEIDRFHNCDLRNLENIKNGYFLMRTATGHGLLDPKAPVLLCPPASPDKDFEIAAVDTDRKDIWIMLKQDY